VVYYIYKQEINKNKENKEEFEMKNVMARAWEIAEEAVKNFGGKKSEYFAKALKMAWAEFNEKIEVIKENLKASFENASIEEIELFITSNTEKLNKEKSHYNRMILKTGIELVKSILEAKTKPEAPEDGEIEVVGIKDWFMFSKLSDHERLAVEYGDIEIIKETEKAYNLKVSCKIGNVYLWAPKSACLTNVA
jgi:hypothetical protein